MKRPCKHRRVRYVAREDCVRCPDCHREWVLPAPTPAAVTMTLGGMTTTTPDHLITRP